MTATPLRLQPSNETVEQKRLARRARLKQAKRKQRTLMWSVRLLSLAILLVIWQWYGS